MHNRIKELLKQAGVSDNWNPADWYSMSPDMVEEFAELLVLECALAIRNDAKKFPLGDVTWIAAMQESARVVTKHFGVEE